MSATTRVRLLLQVLVVGPLVLGLLAAAPPPALAAPGTTHVAAGQHRAGDRRPLPDRDGWLTQVRRRLVGSRDLVDARVRAGREAGERLAINLDIDNTALATYYAPGSAVRPVRRLVRYAARRDVAILFNTGRAGRAFRGTRGELRRAGYPVTAVCHRRTGERVDVGKQRCRRESVAAGYVIVANVGNRVTDFEGGDYEVAYRLPGYGGRLG